MSVPTHKICKNRPKSDSKILTGKLFDSRLVAKNGSYSRFDFFISSFVFNFIDIKLSVQGKSSILLYNMKCMYIL